MRLDGQSADVWKEVKELANEHRLELDGVDEWVQFAELAASDDRPSWHRASDIDTDRVSWPPVFDGLALDTEAEIIEAYERFKALEPPFYHERFFREMCLRVPPGREAECCRAMAGVPAFELYEYARFFETIPAPWLERLAVRAELRVLATTVFRRHCLEVTRGRGYHRLPFELASKITGLSESALIDTVLAALAETTSPFESGRLFTLVSLLAARLSRGEALEGLRYSLAQFDDAIQHDDGDGPWSAQLAPPSDVATALAGYIFAGLGAPTADTRWEAAHVVRCLAAFGCSRVLDPIIRFATTDNGQAFSGAGLHFYVLHARQWLLIALGRAAFESPSGIAPYRDFLLRSALSEGHVLIRHFAATAVLALADRNQADLDETTRTRLRDVNRSTFRKVSSKRWQRTRRPQNGEHDPGRTFTFDYDLAKYDLETLARCFGDGSRVVQIRAALMTPTLGQAAFRIHHRRRPSLFEAF
jgi:hypothetical protein